MQHPLLFGGLLASGASYGVSAYGPRQFYPCRFCRLVEQPCFHGKEWRPPTVNHAVDIHIRTEMPHVIVWERPRWRNPTFVLFDDGSWYRHRLREGEGEGSRSGRLTPARRAMVIDAFDSIELRGQPPTNGGRYQPDGHSYHFCRNEGEAWWCRKIAGMTPRLLPTDGSESQWPRNSGDRERVPLNFETTRTLISNWDVVAHGTAMEYWNLWLHSWESGSRQEPRPSIPMPAWHSEFEIAPPMSDDIYRLRQLFNELVGFSAFSLPRPNL